MSGLHMLRFLFGNSHALTLDPDGPMPVCVRLFTASSPRAATLDVSEFAGLTILITGATSGCGLEVARVISRAGCHLIMTTRNKERGEKALQLVQEEAKSVGATTKIDMAELDMTSIQSVKSLPGSLQKLGIEKLDIALLNAGVYQTEYKSCPETGWEEANQVNFLSTAALTILLRPLVSKASNGRLITVTSETHAWNDPKHGSMKEILKEVNNPDTTVYPCQQRYFMSKLLQLLWTNELASRPEYSDITVAAISPGYTSTGLWRDFNSFNVAILVEKAFCRTIEQGAGQYILALKNLDKGDHTKTFWSDNMWRGPTRVARSETAQEIKSTIYDETVSILKEAGALRDEV